jgi:sec-independent protein translocase protein TatB
MFDIAWSELLLIAVVALIFIGPKELPHVLGSLGRMTAKLRRSADEFRRHFEESMRESGYEDLHKNIQDFRALNPANQLKETIGRAINQDYTNQAQASAAVHQEPQPSPAPASAEPQAVPDPQEVPPQSAPAPAADVSKDRAA